jgi:FkbM family methyltransferase
MQQDLPAQTPASPMSSGNLLGSLARLGKMEAARHDLINTLIQIERNTPYREGVDVREQISGPIVDALFEHGELITKKISSGLKLSFRYTSKIARDFIMSHDAVPDHAWEPQTTRLLLHLSKDAKNIVFGGAYFGDQAIPVAAQVKPSGICHCFELAKENAELLNLNAVQNDLGNVRVLNVGLWSSDDSRLSLDGADSHAAPREDSSGGFSSTTLNRYGRENGIASIDLLMLDIEGGEYPALLGASDYLKQPADTAPNIIFEVHRSYVDWSRGLDNTDVVRYLASLGYSVFAVRDYQSNVPMASHPIELVELARCYLEGPPHGFNLVAVKRPELLNVPFIRYCQDVSPKLLFHRNPKLHGPLG